MLRDTYCAIDWGTTSFRMWITKKDGTVIAERRSAEGITTAANVGFRNVLGAHLAAVNAPRRIPVVVCGMAGARQGWTEAGYIDVPSTLSAIPERAIQVNDPDLDIRILPGLAQRSKDAPDVVRGEETQLLGTTKILGDGRHLVCMPGTHSKWMEISGEKIDRFDTFMTGELFDVVSRYSILKHSLCDDEAVSADSEIFADAVARARRKPELATNLLFSLRARHLLNGLSAADAKAHLSGTLIGLEIAGAVSLAGPASKVCLVSGGSLGSLYRTALESQGLAVSFLDSEYAVRAGLISAAGTIWPK